MLQLSTWAMAAASPPLRVAAACLPQASVTLLLFLYPVFSANSILTYSIPLGIPFPGTRSLNRDADNVAFPIAVAEVDRTRPRRDRCRYLNSKHRAATDRDLS